MNPQTPTTKGPLVGTVIVLILLVLAALYFVNPDSATGPAPENPAGATSSAVPAPESADDLSTLEAEISSISTASINDDMAAFEAEAAAEGEVQ